MEALPALNPVQKAAIAQKFVRAQTLLQDTAKRFWALSKRVRDGTVTSRFMRAKFALDRSRKQLAAIKASPAWKGGATGGRPSFVPAWPVTIAGNARLPISPDLVKQLNAPLKPKKNVRAPTRVNKVNKTRVNKVNKARKNKPATLVRRR